MMLLHKARVHSHKGKKTMIGNHCEQRCDELCRSQLGYTEAIKNLRRDCDHANGGNIPEPVVKSMENDCKNEDRLDNFIKKYGILNKPDNYCHIKYIADGTEFELRRVLSLDVFVEHHVVYDKLKQADSESHSYDSPATIKGYLIEKYAEKNKTEDWGHTGGFEVLNGGTHKLGEVSWWTFSSTDFPIPASGKIYAWELALPETSLTGIELDDSFIEIVLTRSQLKADLFKPTAIEGFYENTPFHPELTGLPYGMTKPSDTSLRGRPELISKSISYVDSGITKIGIRYWSYE